MRGTFTYFFGYGINGLVENTFRWGHIEWTRDFSIRSTNRVGVRMVQILLVERLSFCTGAR